MLTSMRYFVTDLHRTRRVDEHAVCAPSYSRWCVDEYPFLFWCWRSRKEVEKYKYTLAGMTNENKTKYIVSKHIGV